MAYDFRFINAEILCEGSEKYMPHKKSLDLCFTSPPYFDLEKYADEPTQSYIKFNNKEAWVKGFLRPTFENCYYGLKVNKHMLINIADVKGKHNINLEQETVRVAQEVGFKHIGQHQLALSNINLRGKDKKFKYEPIFIFKKT
jgi:DNA modification methylase